jgi:uncharacterized protein (TIGR02145 family)
MLSTNSSALEKERIQGFSVRCINDAISTPPIIIPSVDRLNVRIGETFTPITFSNFGSDVTQWSIRPIPVNGLSFDRNTGTISGKPNRITSGTYYSITATNDFGANTALVHIAVNSVAVPITNIQLDHNTLQIKGKNIIKVGEVIPFSATITPSNATIQDLLWKIKSNHATVSGTRSGVNITGVSAGVVDLYVTSLDGEYVVAKLTIHVIDTIFKDKIYNTVVSPKTKRVWLDRNTGANEVCDDNNNIECYGDLYQFGRASDGHQLRANTNFKNEQSKTATPYKVTFFTNTNQSMNSANDPVVDDRGWFEQTAVSIWDFVSGSSDPYENKPITQQKYDWTVADTKSVDRVKFWSNDIDAPLVTRVCPVGFEVPTIDELTAEMGYLSTSDRDTALKGFLKLPAAGNRQFYDGSLKNEGIEGHYWSKTPVGPHHTQSLVFSPARMEAYRGTDKSINNYVNPLGGKAPIFPEDRYSDTNKPLRVHTGNANGYSIRCIKSEAMKAGGIKYKTVKIGSQRWTVETMRHGDGKDTYNYPVAGLTGKLYTYSVAMNNSQKEGAQGICASGWHVPTRRDWKVLKKYIDVTKNKTGATLFPSLSFNPFANYVGIVVVGRIYFTLWISDKNFNPAVYREKESHVRCIKNEETMNVEGIKYRTVKIGAQVWTSENMRHVSGVNDINTNISNGVYSYDNDISNDKTYGKYYTWSAAMRGSTTAGSQGICASGWHIPTTQDWKTLEMSLDMSPLESSVNTAWRGTDQGTQLKTGGSSAFEAMMTGVVRGGNVTAFDDTLKQTYFWSSEQKASDHNMAWKLALDLSKPKVFYGTTHKTDATSVRCIKNNEVMEVAGIKYNTVTIGEQIWTSENMRHGTNSVENGVYSYKDNTSNDKLYGKSYTWSAAMKGTTKEGGQGICAKNWRIPTEEDWEKLEQYLGMSREAINSEKAWRGTNQGAKLKKSNGIGFNAVLQDGQDPFGHSASVASMWTSTSLRDPDVAHSRTLESTTSKIYKGVDSKVTALGVRCIKQQTIIVTNLALHKKITKSTLVNLGFSDKDPGGFGDKKLGFSPLENTTPKWTIDLGKEHSIDKINIINLTNCCKNKLKSYRVMISNDSAFRKTSYIKDFNNFSDPEKMIDVSKDNLKGRYVRIELPGESELDEVVKVLSAMKVQVLTQENISTITKNLRNEALNARNISLKKPTAQSSTYSTGKSTRVVDGETNGNYSNNSVSCTNEQPQDAWWTLDLQRGYRITKINIFNRTDCCKDRLMNYRVTIADDAGFTKIKYIKEFYIAPSPKATIDLSAYNIEGRHVKIEALKLPGRTSVVSLAEVQVMGI